MSRRKSERSCTKQYRRKKLKCPNDLCGSGHFLYEKEGNQKRGSVNVFSIDLF